MNTTSTSRPCPDAHEPWRVILVGRTGLDQTLRRDAQIELIRCRETIEAIGELGDPIDHESPSQPVVIVSPDAIGDEPRERKQFVNALRLIDPTVRVLIVNEDDNVFDASIQRDQPLDDLVETIACCIDEQEPEPVSLRFIDLSDLDQITTDQTSAQTNEAADEAADQGINQETDQENDEASAEDKPATEPETPVKPEVAVVVDNQTFEHRAQRPFEEEDELHKQIVMGITPDQPLPQTTPRTAPVVLDDEPLVRAMLRGKSMLEPAIAQINTRLGRSDIDLIQSDAAGAAQGVPVVVADKTVGVLTCDDASWINGVGRALLASHAQWLAAWIKLEAQQSELRRCAFTDSLTGAWNRRYFERFLAAAIDQSRLARRPLTVMIFDIDSFKHYNDTYGHAAGDEILAETVKLLKSVIRPSDRVCRVGGDEFAVIFYEPQGPRDPSSKPLESIYQIAKRFQKQVCQHRFPKLGAEAMGTLTISGGLASYPWDGHDAASLLESADQCAMESKRQGKNAISLGPGAESVCRTEH
ncbi:MAG: GGDEF domain-containing protein [Phycisphaerales bacterium JB052]